jgi:hypothetical protein
MVLVTTLFGWLFLQTYVQLPNGYELDVDRDPPRYAAPCDRDNIVAVEVPTARLFGSGKLSLRYDEEDRKLGGDADTVMMRLQYRW